MAERMDALKVDCPANNLAVKVEQPALNSPTGITEIESMGTAVKTEETDIGVSSADQCEDRQSTIANGRHSPIFVDPIVIAPLKMEDGEPLEPAGTPIVTSDELNDEPTTSSVMNLSQQRKPDPRHALGTDQTGSAKFDQCIASQRRYVPVVDDCSAQESSGDDEASESKPPLGQETAENQFQCSVCSKLFFPSRALKAHMCTHAGLKVYPCTMCTKSFVRSCHLKVHMRTHTGEKPYQCMVCSKPFRQSFQLKVHMRIHTGERPHHCPMCSKTFNQSAPLVAHMRTHTGERPYQCSMCSKSFVRSDHLNGHMQTHTEEKPFQCTVCSKSFTRLYSLKVHMRTHTKEKPPVCDVLQVIVPFLATE